VIKKYQQFFRTFNGVINMIVNNINDIEYTVMLLSLFGQWFEFNMNFDVLHER